MTTYVLSLSGDEDKARIAAPWARFRRARLLSVSRRPVVVVAAAADDGVALADRARTDAGAWTAGRDAASLAALLLRTLDMQDGFGVVVADFDDEAFAADVVARIAALGRDVTWAGRVARVGFGARVRRHSAFWRSTTGKSLATFQGGARNA